MNRFTRSRRGANAIEFGLTLPFFLIILFGMMEYGWYFSRVALVNSAVLDGCREGSLVDERNGDPAQVATDRMTELLNASGETCGGCVAIVRGAVPNKVVECRASIQYPGLTGMFRNLGIPEEVGTLSQARLEWQRI